MKTVQAQRTETSLSGRGWRMWLDKEAAWEKDKLYLPPVNLETLPKNPPTGGWEILNPKNGIAVSVPGTVEEYVFRNYYIITSKNQGVGRASNIIDDYKGVSWWWRNLDIPKGAEGKRIILQFEAVRLRAEVFINDEFVAYDVIGNTPFEVDITGKVKIGASNRLAIRVTDPGGNFFWYDMDVDRWGDYKMPMSHGFGGITGRIKLRIVDPIYVSDIFIKNKPSIKDIEVTITVNNSTGEATTGNVDIAIKEPTQKAKPLWIENVSNVPLAPGENVFTRGISVPQAKIWNLENPNLYTCEVSISSKNAQFNDSKNVRFGFRWFGLDKVGEDAMFRLNGKRIVLRSAISWGFWPTNGMYATAEMAEREIQAAKALGQNMINFHRCIGQPICFEKADEMGLLYFEEPGGYACHNGDDFSNAWAREKLLRMVKRDRNHPSLVIYNMINEETIPPVDRNRKDLADAHTLDPSRVILYTSGWAKEGDDPIKLHMRPYDDKQYINGWYDVHHAMGPGTYRDEFYQNPTNYMLFTKNNAEIVFWGEEAANSAPPRLHKIAEYLKKTKRNGWDGAAFKEWYEAYEKYLDAKKLRKYFPTVDGLTLSMGNTPYYYQGRIIENIRIGNVTDGYVVNGWECEKIENHSGIVDSFRNPKGDTNIFSYYNSPLYVAVKARTKIVQIPAMVTADFFVVNELDLKGPHTLKVALKEPKGKIIWNKDFPANVSGGDVFGELLTEDVQMEIANATGYFTIEASLVGADSKVKATGRDEIFAVDWKSSKIPANGAVLEEGRAFRDFLEKEKGTKLPDYTPEMGKLDYIIVGAVEPEQWVPIPKESLLTGNGDEMGLTGEYFKGMDLKNSVGKRVDTDINFDWSGKEPFESIGKEIYSVRWTGKVKPAESGNYIFRTQTDDGVRLWVNGKLVIDNWTNHAPQFDSSDRIALEAGKTYDVKLEFFQNLGGAVVRLYWTTPPMTAKGDAFAKSILDRVKNDGATALFIDGADRWIKNLSEAGIVKYKGTMEVGSVWIGGNLFVREHPLFKDLPVNQGMNWEYQDTAFYGARRYGFILEGEEAVVGTVNAHEPRVGTAVAVCSYGKGKIVISTLDIARFLNTQSSGVNVTRKILCNYLEYCAGSK